MTLDQGLLFTLLLVVFALLIWGRWRYDLVAFVALLAAVLLGLVPVDRAFSGFGHPATIIIALVLIVSKGLSNTGVIEYLARRFINGERGVAGHIGLMSGLAAGLSAVMNNVAALALLMPLDLQAAKKAGRSAAVTLMPLSFASILGGMVTLIGTPPNIVIAEYRGDALGRPFQMLDFAPVGLVCAAVGVAYVALIGWRGRGGGKEERGRRGGRRRLTKQSKTLPSPFPLISPLGNGLHLFAGGNLTLPIHGGGHTGWGKKGEKKWEIGVRLRCEGLGWEGI